MAMTGLDIYKLTPKKNCKECGFPTCMAFSMKVAAGGAEIEKCPHMSEESLAKLSASTAPLMKTISFGQGESEYKLGGETVLFRHDKTFVNRNRYAVLFSDAMSAEEVDAKIDLMEKVCYVRIGEEMKAEIAALEYTGKKDAYLGLVKKVKESGVKAAYLLACEDTAIAKEALALVQGTKPLLYGGTQDNYEQMVELAKGAGGALGLKADSLEALYDLTEKVQKLGYTELFLDAGNASLAEAFKNTVQIRRIALKEQDRTFGYPSIVFANRLAGGDKYVETALASLFTVKYGSIVVLNDMDYARALPLYGLRQNIFTDPQKPMRVEPKVYSINNADENAPVFLTVDFALTYFMVSGEIERSKLPAWLAIPDAGGYSVLTAWAAGKLGGSSISKFIKESGVEELTKNRKLIIPGKIAVLKGDIEDSLPGWEVVMGPNEAMNIPKFFRALNENS